MALADWLSAETTGDSVVLGATPSLEAESVTYGTGTTTVAELLDAEAVVLAAMLSVVPTGKTVKAEDGNVTEAGKLTPVGPVSAKLYESDDAEAAEAETDDAEAELVGAGLEYAELSMTVDRPTMMEPVYALELDDSVEAAPATLLLLLAAVGDTTVSGISPVLAWLVALDSASME